MAFEIVIGLEAHIQLRTASKAFCSCAAEYGALPNSNVCPVCCGLPGALPVLNAKVVEQAVMLAKALGAEINLISAFERKNYFYADLPKGYQITQRSRPIAAGGTLPVGGELIELMQLQIEEDSAKMIHEGSLSRLDHNRAGIALLEVVSLPVLSSVAQAVDFARSLLRLVRCLGICSGNMAEGAFRIDANISLAGSEKVEIKNLNSLRNMAKALEYEVGRQQEILLQGGRVLPETRSFDGVRTVARRSKDISYRYFDEPDLPLLRLDRAWVDAIALPELPWQRAGRYGSMGLKHPELLSESIALAGYFEATLEYCHDRLLVERWLINDLCHFIDDRHRLDGLKISPAMFGELLNLVADKQLSPRRARGVLAEMAGSGRSAGEILAGECQLNDADALRGMIKEVIGANPRAADEYCQGKEQVLSFLIGQLMKRTRGRANPELSRKLIKEQLK